MDTSNPLLSVLFEAASDGMYFVDRERRITAWNAASERITGYMRKQVIGELCMSNLLMHCDDSGKRLCLDGCPLASTLFDGKEREGHVFLRHADGHRVPVHVRIYPVVEDGEVTGALEVFNASSAITSTTDRLYALEQATMRDPLTGAASRRMGQSRLESAIEEWQEHCAPFGILMVDVDHFKSVNDQYGHPTGDRVLGMVAASLASSLRPHDLVVRWGGEEFIIIVTSVTIEGLAQVGERVRMLVEQSTLHLSEEDRIAGNGLSVTVSLGAAYIQPGEDLNSLLVRADQNMYKSKRNGRNCLTV
jgi:diguanylate cyclase (GGDEF)-like protein/PAS domain S-box-containing protein